MEAGISDHVWSSSTALLAGHAGPVSANLDPRRDMFSREQEVVTSAADAECFVAFAQDFGSVGIEAPD